MNTQQINNDKTLVIKWEKDFAQMGKLPSKTELIHFIRTHNEEEYPKELSQAYTLLALTRDGSIDDKLSATWMNQARKLDPENIKASEYFIEQQWITKKDLLKQLIFPSIRETDNRTAKKKIAEEYIHICREFLEAAEDFSTITTQKESTANDKINSIKTLLEEVIEETQLLLKAAGEYEQSITGVFYTSVHYNDLKIHLENIEIIKNKWASLYEEDTSKTLEEKSPLNELNEMIGMNSVKERVEDYYRFLKFQKKRKELGFHIQDEISLNMVLTGNPGTGKTTLARLLAKIYHELGVLPKEHVVEADRSQLIGAFVGQTEENVRALVEKAIGGVLFIDEAYNLKRDGQSGSDYGQTVIDTLVSLMTGHEFGGKFAVILAGYPDEMRQFIDANPGLRSRFPQSNQFHLDDYSNDELVQIAEKMASENDYIITDEAKIALNDVIERERVDDTFGNARTVRNLVLDAIFKKGSRAQSNTDDLTAFTFIEKCDFGHCDETKSIQPAATLKSLIGLDNIKEEMTALVSFLKMQQLRKEKGLPSVPIQLHSVFSGNPGTGKTTVAKIYAEYLKECGILKRGHLIITSRADFVAGYVGQTAIKTKKKIREALGGVLFIDEAYSLLGNSKGDFGKEVIDTLVDEMTIHNENLVVILAGYPNEMEDLLDSNPGLRSRFKKFFAFEDYNAAEMVAIVLEHARKFQYEIGQKEQKLLLTTFENNSFKGNGRFAANLLDEMIQVQAVRIMNSENQKILNDDYFILNEIDVEKALAKMGSGGSHVNHNEGN